MRRTLNAPSQDAQTVMLCSWLASGFYKTEAELKLLRLVAGSTGLRKAQGEFQIQPYGEIHNL